MILTVTIRTDDGKAVGVFELTPQELGIGQGLRGLYGGANYDIGGVLYHFECQAYDLAGLREAYKEKPAKGGEA